MGQAGVIAEVYCDVCSGDPLARRGTLVSNSFQRSSVGVVKVRVLWFPEISSSVWNCKDYKCASEWNSYDSVSPLEI